ncbi:dehydrodolichyl diphosphate synthase 2-like [Canna indica]|uniref:Alkyl transferase n=1 Tax=Canna indica TaxID=4628 RepID=A0AAQ3JQ07_9LILI|nr:dehydrodolichyl diphosphate synthase 2-like [Canna indica]
MLSTVHTAFPLNHQKPYSAHLCSLSSRGIIANTSLLLTPTRPRSSPSLCAALPTDASSAAAATVREESEEGAALPSLLRQGPLPKHVAIIMDGSSRWARARGMPSSFGHEAGHRALKKIVELSGRWGVRALTVYAFSSENWTRPEAEVDFLMMLFESVLKGSLGDFMKDEISVSIIGDITELPQSLQKLAKEVVDMTKKNTKLDVLVAISYSGRRELKRACQNIAQKVKHGLLAPEDITESHIEQELETNHIEFPHPDLLIRTSGELRVSNFLLWQLAYTELFFTKTYWPDFGEEDYVEALHSFQSRQRRFGQRLN